MVNTNGRYNSINNRQLAILETLSTQSKTISQIAENVGISNGQTSQLVMKLHDLGFLSKERNGNSVTVSFSDRLFAEYLRGVILRDRIDLRNTLKHPCFDILLVLGDRELDRKKIGLEVKASPYQVRSCTRELEKKGFVGKHGDNITLSGSLPFFASFLKSYSSYSNFRKLKGLTKKGVIVWQRANEFIFFAPSDEKIENAQLTGVSAMSRYGIDIVSERAYYHCFENGRQLRIEDIAIDTLLAANPRPRAILYALLFLRKMMEEVDAEYLISRGKEVGEERIVRDLLAFLRGKKPKSEGFPSREEFSQTCAVYGVNPSIQISSQKKTSSTGSSI